MQVDVHMQRRRMLAWTRHWHEGAVLQGCGQMLRCQNEGVEQGQSFGPSLPNLKVPHNVCSALNSCRPLASSDIAIIEVSHRLDHDASCLPTHPRAC